MIIAWGLTGWLIAGGVLVLLWVVFTYNAFVRHGNKVNEAWSGIDVQLKRRSDLIPNLVETVKAVVHSQSHQKVVSLDSQI